MAEPKSYLARVAEAAVRVFSPNKTVEDDLLRERNQRNLRYAANWEEYRGVTLERLKNEDGTDQNPINTLKKNIDKINYFAFGKGFDLISDDYAPHMKRAVACWGTKLVEKLSRMGQTGAVCGDAYIMVLPVEMGKRFRVWDEASMTIRTEIDAQLTVVILNSSYCTPIYDTFDADNLRGMSIDIPVKAFGSDGRWTTNYQHMTITDDRVYSVTRDMNGNEIAGTSSEEKNRIGSVYVHHIRNFPDGDSLYGMDDITDVAPLNRELSKEINGIGKIISYHGDPITLIFGARGTNLQKGANKIWSGLPKDARVENLTLDTDLTAATTHLDTLTESLHILMGVPEIAQGSKQAISNTSGVALQTMYMPLIEKASTKHSMYGPHLVEVAITCLRWIEELNINIPGIEKTDKRAKKLTEEDYAKIRKDTVVKFPSVLPKDRLIESQIQTTLIQGQLQSQEAALIELGVSEPQALIAAIDAELAKKDEREAAKMERTMAMKGNNDKESKIESGSSAGNGVNTGDSEAQKGRKKTKEKSARANKSK